MACRESLFRIIVIRIKELNSQLLKSNIKSSEIFLNALKKILQSIGLLVVMEKILLIVQRGLGLL